MTFAKDNNNKNIQSQNSDKFNDYGLKNILNNNKEYNVTNDILNSTIRKTNHIDDLNNKNNNNNNNFNDNKVFENKVNLLPDNNINNNINSNNISQSNNSEFNLNNHIQFLSKFDQLLESKEGKRFFKNELSNKDIDSNNINILNNQTMNFKNDLNNLNINNNNIRNPSPQNKIKLIIII